MTFNEMYGIGAMLGFTIACRFPLLENVSDPTISEFPGEDGHVRVNVTWEVDGGASTAIMKIDCTPTTVHFLTLRSGADHPTGIYTALCLALPDFFQRRGVEYFTAQPSGVNSEGVLRQRGGWEPGDFLRWRVRP